MRTRVSEIQFYQIFSRRCQNSVQQILSFSQVSILPIDILLKLLTICFRQFTDVLDDEAIVFGIDNQFSEFTKVDCLTGSPTHADLLATAKWINVGKFSNAGQTCIAPDHVFVHRSVKVDFVAALRDLIARTYGDGNSSPHLARLVNDKHATRLSGLLQDAASKGAHVILDGTPQGRNMGPTLIEAITPDMEIDHEEIFGPILPIITYDDIDEGIQQINARPKPLALYIFDKNRAQTDDIIAATSSGGVGVNLTSAQGAHHGIPFGGVNGSGIGASHGLAGFRAFSHERAILTNHFSWLPLIFPPYTGRVKRLIGIAKRFLG